MAPVEDTLSAVLLVAVAAAAAAVDVVQGTPEVKVIKFWEFLSPGAFTLKLYTLVINVCREIG